MNKIIMIQCPQCEKAFNYYQSASRPFCSEKCKMIDLGHWFEESYRVPIKGSMTEEIENDNEFLINEEGSENEES